MKNSLAIVYNTITQQKQNLEKELEKEIRNVLELKKENINNEKSMIVFHNNLYDDTGLSFTVFRSYSYSHKEKRDIIMSYEEKIGIKVGSATNNEIENIIKLFPLKRGYKITKLAE